MTEKVKRYIEIGKELSELWEKMDNISDVEFNKKDEELGKENENIKSQMTVSELESLKPYISAREFSLAIKPLIEAKSRNNP